MNFAPKLIAVTAACGLALPALARAEHAQQQKTHVVGEGDSLWTISRAYGCDVDSIKRANQLRDDMIYAGQTLAIPTCSPADRQARVAIATNRMDRTDLLPGGAVVHTVQAGESLWTISKKYDTSVEDIQVRNGLASADIMAGQRLEILPGSGKSARAILGQSVGSPHSGRLVKPSRLPNSPDYVIRRPHRAYGASHVVFHVKRAARVVRGRFPGTHRLAIGDLSAKDGGKITEHRSHQTGRDVDIGFFFKKKPSQYPKRFVRATRSNLHFPATWELLVTLVATADSDTGVERIFLGYETQKLLYEWAREQGVARRTLDRMFQYPYGRDTPHGIIRHENGHDDHFHVRFKCPSRDRSCR